MRKNIFVSINKMRIFLTELFMNLELTFNEVNQLVDYYVEVEVNGTQSHGLSVLAANVMKFKRKSFNLNPDIHIISQNNNYSIIDADNSHGVLSSNFAIDIGIAKAFDHGIHSVFVRNANTIGAGYYYTNKISQNSLIGIVISNTPPAMAPWGGLEKLLGTNPLAITIPADNIENNIVFDMATSVVAKSKINEYRKRGEEIPYGWATDLEGLATKSPNDAINGLISPVGEHKGYGLSLIIDILSGMLSGSGYLDKVKKFYSDDESSMNVGHLFIVINPKLIYGDDFFTKVTDYVNTIRNSKSIGLKNVKVPGDGKRLHKKLCQKQGIMLSEETYKDLRELINIFEIKEAIL